MASSIAGDTGRLMLRAGLLAPGVVMLFWLLIAGTRRWRLDIYWQRFPPNFGCDSTKLLDACEAEQLAYFWLAPAVAALSGLGLLCSYELFSSNALTPHSDPGSNGASGRPPRAKAARSAPLMQRLAGLQLPPRRFWAWWCGGMSGADAAAVLLWVAANCLWMAAIMRRYLSLLPLFQRLTKHPTWELELQLVAVALGSLLFPNLLMLFLPVSRGSVLLQASGLSYPAAIRYHRWLGHAVMTIATAHSLGFWGVWLYQGTWLQDALEMGSRVNNLAGGVSFLAGLALWLTSLEAARRANYDLFYKVHHLGFWGFMVAGIMHYWSMFWYFLPGMMLYAVDGAYRLMQATPGGGGAARVLAAEASGGGKAPAVVSLTLLSRHFAPAPSGFLWLRVGAVSATEWHPFEYVAVAPGAGAAGACPADGERAGRGRGGAAPAAVLLHIKAYNRWTQRLAALVGARGAAGLSGVLLEAPYPDLPTFHHHQEAPVQDAMIMVAGGIGISAALSLLQELDGTTAATTPCLLIWSCRSTQELTFLAPRLLGAAAAKKLPLEVQLFYTGSMSDLQEVTQQGPGVAGPPAGVPDVALLALPQPLLPARPTSTTSLCPVLAATSLSWQAVQKLVVHVLVFAGALGAVLGVRAWGVLGRPEPLTTFQLGAATVLAVGAASLLPSMALLAASMLLAGRARSAPVPQGDQDGGLGSERQPLLAAGSRTDAYEPARLVVQEGGARVLAGGAHEQGAEDGQVVLPLRFGRPPLEQLLSSWLAQLQCAPRASGGQLRVGVYAMGPSAMVGAVQLLCDDVNRRSGVLGVGAPHLVFYQRTHEL